MNIHVTGLIISNDTQVTRILNFHQHFRKTVISGIFLIKFITASGLGLDILQDSGKFSCAVCRTGVGRSSIRCSKCNLWVHYKKCSGLKTLSEDLSYECPRCRGVPGVVCTPCRWPPFQGGWGWWLCARGGWSFLLPGWHAQCWWWLHGCCHC